MGDDNIGTFFDTDAAGTYFAIETASRTDAGLAVAEDFSGGSASDISLSANG